MKIAFFMATILEHAGGHENSFISAAYALADDPSNEVTIVTMDENFTRRLGRLTSVYYRKNLLKTDLKRESTESVIIKLGKANYHKCKKIKDVRKMLSQYDVVYSKNELLESAILKIFVRYGKIPPVVFECATPVYYPYADSFTAKLHNILYSGFIYRWLIDGVVQMHVKNSFDKRRYAKMYQKQRVYYRYNGFDFEHMRELARHNKYTGSWNEDSFNIIWVGRLTEQKGIGLLKAVIEETEQLKIYPSIEWHIIGEGDERALVEKITSEHDNVRYHGHVENNKVFGLYKKCDLYVSTASWETFGNTLVEAMTMDVPVISRRIPGPEDIVINGTNGFFAETPREYAEAISKVYRNQAKFGDIAKSVTDRFDKKSSYSLLSELLKNAACLQK